MTRVLSGAVLLVFAIVVVWLAPAPVFLAVALALLLIACHEYDGLAQASGLQIPIVPSGAAAVLGVFYAIWWHHTGIKFLHVQR